MERASLLTNLGELLKRRGLVLAICVLFVLIFISASSGHLQSTVSTIQSRPWFGSPAAVTPPKPVAENTIATTFNGTWDFTRDRKNLLFNNAQCDALFPDLYEEIDRAVRDRNGQQITLAELDSIEPRNGYVRGIIYDQQVRRPLVGEVAPC